MTFWAYVLRCKDDSFYTGHSDALEARIGAHQSGAITGHARSRRPVVLVWSQEFPTRLEALKAERRIKGWTRAKKEALIAGDWDRVSLLARNRQDVSRPSTGSGRREMVIGQSFPTVRPEPVEGRPIHAADREIRS